MQDTRGLSTWEIGLYKIRGFSSLGGGAIQDTRGLISGVSSTGRERGGSIQDTRGLITGEAGYTRYQGSHQWG